MARGTLLLLLALAGCDDAVTPDQRTVYGTPQRLGDGTARTYLVVEDDVPVEFGVALTEKALEGLPSQEGGAGHSSVSELILPLPGRNPTPFRLVELNWHPGGHPPAPYGQPHLDFHFYTITLEERNKIDPLDPLFNEKAKRYPSDGYMPAGYLPTPDAVPRMGVHWVNPASPELNGQPFTRTFLYGSWDRRTIFLEPMITREYLESKPSVTEQIPIPSKYEPGGYYPTSQLIQWDAARKEYRIGVGGFVRR